MGGELIVRRLALMLVLATAVVVMHVLSTPSTSHHSPLGVMAAMAPMADALQAFTRDMATLPPATRPLPSPPVICCR